MIKFKYNIKKFKNIILISSQIKINKKARILYKKKIKCLLKSNYFKNMNHKKNLLLIIFKISIEFIF